MRSIINRKLDLGLLQLELSIGKACQENFD